MSFGWAAYWNAGITIFLSEDKVEVMPVVTSTDTSMFRWNTRKSYEEKIPQFILLTVSEYEERKACGYNEEVLFSDENYVILKYLN